MNVDEAERLPGFPSIGDVIAGRYRLQAVASIGRTGVTFRATQVRSGRAVALKVAARDVKALPGAAARVVRAARLSNELASPHLAHVKDGGVLESGSPWAVTEWLDGCTLAELLQTGTLPMEIAVDHVLQACEVLAELHGRGVVHRALCTESIFLFRANDGRAYVRLLDCGAAKVGADGGGQRRGSDGVASAYSSPELLADPRNVDERADVWSLGVILFELVTGTLPFGDGAVDDLSTAVLVQPRPKVSAVDPRLPRALDLVLGRCLQAKRATRMPSVKSLASALVPFGGALAAARAARIQGIAEAANALPNVVLVPEVVEGSKSNLGDGDSESAPPTSATVRPPSLVERDLSAIGPAAGRLRLRLAAAGVLAASVVAVILLSHGREGRVQGSFVAPMPFEVAPVVVVSATPPSSPEPSAEPNAEPSQQAIRIAPTAPPTPIPATRRVAPSPPRVTVVGGKAPLASSPPRAPPFLAALYGEARPPRHTTPRLSTTVFPEDQPKPPPTGRR